MISTSRRGIRILVLWPWVMLALALMPQARAADPQLPCPPQLKPAVDFWVRVYTRIDTNSGYLHDQYHLSVIYRTLHFDPGTPRRRRERIVERARERVAAQLRQIAADAHPLTPGERRIEALWGARATPAVLRRAANNIRFQLGQSNRFKAGLIRSGAWQQAIARALARMGLPPELAALPLVESSYNPRAYSKDGAAGLWQFMPSTGRRFLRIGPAIDERLDPFRATVAAAQLLAYNHRILGTWPLAITAYNHGVAGVRRAVRTLGTTNIAALVRDYHTRTFAFASRNFYVSFLAALRVERHAHRYFGQIRKLPEERFRELTLPAYVAVGPLEQVLDISGGRLRELNPALRPSVWDGRLDVPKGYRLRLPEGGPLWTAALLERRLGPQQLLAAQKRPPSYRVRRGDTLSGIAARYRLGVLALAQFNDIRPGALLRVGERIALPGAVRTVLAASAGHAPKQPGAPSELPAATRAMSAPAASVLSFNASASGPSLARAPATPGLSPPATSVEAGFTLGSSAVDTIASLENAQPVSAAQAQALSPMLGPAGSTARSADPTDYLVARNGTIRVAAEESLGYYAEWLDVSAMDLRRINHLQFGRPVRIGQRIRLDFRHVSRRQFVRQRIAYHRALEASYFATHRIEGTRLYLVHGGDSLWTLTQRFPLLPSWLLRQYNPDTDFSDLHPGSQLVIPRIAAVSAGG